MKKAFCQPGNTDFCPPITLACAFGLTCSDSSILISRSEENGGDVSFSSEAELRKSFGDGSLHPGDLKAASSKIMVGVLEKLSKALKEHAKSVKGLKAFDKKMSKQLQKDKK